MSDVIIYGAGAWGTALAIHAARLGHGVTLWARDAGRAAEMQTTRVNTRLLPGAAFPEGLRVTHDMAPGGAALGILAIPMQPLRAMLGTLPRGLPPLLLVCKGLEADTLHLPMELLGEARPDLEGGILSGPNFAHEVAAGLPAASVVAARDPALAALAQSLLSGAALRLYASEDVLGVQLGGAAKNVLAIAAGISTGAGLGENARAALITRGLAELSRLVIGLGGRPETAAGLSGLGDLILTAMGNSSRNASLGFALGRGMTLAQALAGRAGVTEGIATAPALLERARAAGVELPICAAVVAVLQGRLDVQGALGGLMARPLRPE